MENTLTAAKAGQTKPPSLLAALPEELRLRIFKALLTSTTRTENGAYIINGRFNHPVFANNDLLDRRSAKVFLDQYGTLCRALRPSAVTAYYEHGVLKLCVAEDAEVTEYARKKKSRSSLKASLVRNTLTEERWVRYGQIYLARDTLDQKRYALELPPRYIRPLIRRIELHIPVPDGKVHASEMSAEIMGRRRYVQTTGYDHDENDWLAPIMKLCSEYGFLKKARVVVKFELRLQSEWTLQGVQKLIMWVDEELRADAEVEEALDSGMIELDWETVRWVCLR